MLAKKVYAKGHQVYIISGDDVEKEYIEKLGFNFTCIPYALRFKKINVVVP